MIPFMIIITEAYLSSSLLSFSSVLSSTGFSASSVLLATSVTSVLTFSSSAGGALSPFVFTASAKGAVPALFAALETDSVFFFPVLLRRVLVLPVSVPPNIASYNQQVPEYTSQRYLRYGSLF